VDPFESTEKAAIEVLNKWGKGVFSVNRQLYEKDENICSALENAIWV
jgi:hypothetical protein